MAAILLVFSRLDFQASNVLLYVAILAFCLAFISSSFDVVFDAWRTEILPKKIMGLGAGWSVVGYRVAMITSGALALLLADLYFGFSGVYFLFAILFLFLALVASLIPEAPTKNSPKSLREAIREPFKEFFSRKNALLILITIILYKLGDAFALSLSTAFLIRGAGFSPGEVGAVAKGVGLFAALGGGLIGGWLLSKSNLFLCLVWFGIFQALSNLGFLWLSLISPTVTEMAFVIVFENLSGGMGTAAFVALLMALCNQRFTATQFALLSALSSVGRVFIGPFAGEIAYNFEWPIFFVCSFLVAVPGIILIYFIRHEIKEIF
jgi:PAT family beta-lactamase induction signal transducer AmpG